MAKLPSTWLVAALAALMVAVASAEEEEKVSGTSMAVCIMLMGTVGSTMGAFYLVNHSDKDIKIAAWRIICNTISIFAAVLLFQAVNGVVTYFFLAGMPLWVKVTVAFLHSGTWFAVLQLFLACISRAIPTPKWLLKPIPEGEGEEHEEMLECIRLDMKCWGILFGHIAGFASINAWCVVQQFFKESITGSLLVIPGAAVSLWLTFLITDMCREHIALADDGVKDDNEILWDDSVEETEEDVRALTLSFLSVQWLRFAIFGVLPSAEGDMPDRAYTDGQMLTLLGVALLLCFYANIPGRYLCKKRCHTNSEPMTLILNLVFSWGIMYTFRIWLLTNKYLGGDAFGEVLQATIVTWATFLLTFLLDWLADLEFTDKETDVAIRSVMCTLSVLVGFSWEKCFDVAVDNIAERVTSMPQPVTKLLMGLVLVASVLPSWRWYILPVLDRLGGFEEEEEEEEEEGGECEDPKESAEGYKPLPATAKEVQVAAAAPPVAEPSSEVQALKRQAQALQAELHQVRTLHLETSKAAEAHAAAKNHEAAKVEALQGRLRDLEQQQAGSRASDRDLEALQQKIRAHAQHSEQQEGRISAALQAEQDQRTRVFQLEAEKSQLEARMLELGTASKSKADTAGQLQVQLGELQAENGKLCMELRDLQGHLDAHREGEAGYQAENKQLNTRLKELQGQLDMHRGTQAAYQAEKAQFEARIGEMTTQLEAAVRTKDEKLQLEAEISSLAAQLDSVMQGKAANGGAEAARVQELEQLQAASSAQHSRIRELEAQVLADAERKASLEAHVHSLTKNVEDLVARAQNPDPTAGDDLVRTLAGVPLQSGSSLEVAAGMPPVTQASPPLEPLSMQSMGQRAGPPLEPLSMQSMGQRAAGPAVPNAAAPPQLLTAARSQPTSPNSTRAKEAPPTGKSPPVRTAAPNRKTPALQPGQAPAAPRLSTSEPQEIQRSGGSGAAVAQPRMMLPGSSRGSSSKEAVFPITSVQPQPSRLINRDAARRS